MDWVCTLTALYAFAYGCAYVCVRACVCECASQCVRVLEVSKYRSLSIIMQPKILF